MRNYQTIIIEKQDGITTVRLNRPEHHNAMNEEMIAELTEIFQQFNQKENRPRAVVLRGNGKSFCAGADLNYMKNIAGLGFEANVKDGLKLTALFRSVYDCPVPTLAVVHGSAFGGANGLMAACDMAIAAENTHFAFSEVKLGIAPATIAPFVIKRIGEFGAKELMITGKRFDGKEAARWHLVNHAVPAEKLEETLQQLLGEILSAAPNAIIETKILIQKIISDNNLNENIDFTSRLIARLRASEEGQEGMAAFLEKRKTKWNEK